MGKVNKAWFIGVDGSRRRIPEFEGRSDVSLREMYPLIGLHCHIVERVGLKRGVDMWVDEEGLLKENFINPEATALYRAAFPNVNPSELGIVGNAIVLDNTKAGDFFE